MLLCRLFHNSGSPPALQGKDSQQHFLGWGLGAPLDVMMRQKFVLAFPHLQSNLCTSLPPPAALCNAGHPTSAQLCANIISKWCGRRKEISGWLLQHFLILSGTFLAHCMLFLLQAHPQPVGSARSSCCWHLLMQGFPTGPEWW